MKKLILLIISCTWAFTSFAFDYDKNRSSIGFGLPNSDYNSHDAENGFYFLNVNENESVNTDSICGVVPFCNGVTLHLSRDFYSKRENGIREYKYRNFAGSLDLHFQKVLWDSIALSFDFPILSYSNTRIESESDQNGYNEERYALLGFPFSSATLASAAVELDLWGFIIGYRISTYSVFDAEKGGPNKVTLNHIVTFGFSGAKRYNFD